MNILIMTLSLGALQFILALWIKVRVEESIKTEKAKLLEQYKIHLLRKQKAEIIAEFFAKWIKYRTNVEKFLTPREQVDYYEELNRMSLQISLWIDDPELLDDIMSTFKHGENAKNIRELTGLVRKRILDNPKDNFNPQHIILWPSTAKENELFYDRK